MLRFRPDIKPPQWGPPGAVAYAVRENAQRLLGANPVACLPLWESGFRTQIFDVFGNAVSAPSTAHDWNNYGYFTGNNVSGSGVLVSLSSPVANTAFSVFIASRRILQINFRDHISVGFGTTWRASASMSGTSGNHMSFGNGTGYAGNSAEIASGDDFTAALVLDLAASTRRMYVDDKVVSFPYTPAQENFDRIRLHNRVGDDTRSPNSSLKTALAFDSVLSSAAVARLNYEPYTLLMPVARPVYFDLGASEPTVITGTMAVTETGHDTATIIGQLLISGLMDVSEVGDDVFAAIGSALHAITGDMAVSEAGSDIFAALGVVTDTEPITAAEVARIVRATPRMKTVTASARVKQVRYEIARA